MRNILAPAALLAAAAAVAGCAYPNPLHVQALNALVGKPEPELVRARGVPSRSYETAGLKFLAYDMRRIDSFPGELGYGFPGYGWGGYGGGYGGGGFGYGGFGGGFGPEIIQRDCETTFELKAGIVQRWSLRGNDC